MRSRPECAASERMPKLPVVTPTAIFRLVITIAANTEFPAAARFSARINSDEEMAGVPDTRELSPQRARPDKTASVIEPLNH